MGRGLTSIRELAILYVDQSASRGPPMSIGLIPEFLRDHYEIHEWRHASAILTHDFPQEFQDIADVLTRFRLLKSHIVVGGGRKSRVSSWIDQELYSKGWIEKKFDTRITIDDGPAKSRVETWC